MTYQFPRLSAVVRDIDNAFSAINNGARPTPPAPAHADPYRLYAEEMLPAILKGRWRHRPYLSLSELVDDDIRLHLGIFDHAAVFRRIGSRGPATWNTTAVIGMPYNINGAEDCTRYLRERYQVHCWARGDLSCFYPGRTLLVVAARELEKWDPVRWGFLSLTDCYPIRK